ncbi:putative cation/H+ exchanger, CPA1 family [Helianthus anomalus]
MNELITTLLIGLCTRVVILLISGGTSSHLLVFSEDLFFIYLLPLIIFNAGYVLVSFYTVNYHVEFLYRLFVNSS